jgi:hypothetical protein
MDTRAATHHCQVSHVWKMSSSACGHQGKNQVPRRFVFPQVTASHSRSALDAVSPKTGRFRTSLLHALLHSDFGTTVGNCPIVPSTCGFVGGR